MTMIEAREVVRAAQGAKGSTLMVDQKLRWQSADSDAAQGAARRAGRDDRLDRLRVPASHHADDHGWGGGRRWRIPFLHDMAPHHVDLMRACTGLECRQVMAVGVAPPMELATRGLPGVDAISPSNRGWRRSLTATMVGARLGTPQDGIITVMGEQGMLRL